MQNGVSEGNVVVVLFAVTGLLLSSIEVRSLTKVGLKTHALSGMLAPAVLDAAGTPQVLVPGHSSPTEQVDPFSCRGQKF